MKRNIVVIMMAVSILLMVVIIAGCAPSPATTQPAEKEQVSQPTTAPAPAESSTEQKAEGETITVIFPQHEADLSGAFEARVRDFEKESGIKVTLIQSEIYVSSINPIFPGFYKFRSHI